MSSKCCIKCKKVKPIEAFHKHKMMSDGRLNKCGVCVKDAVAQWRLDNPGCRAKEHERNRKAKGIRTRSEYLKEKSENAIGRRASLAKYTAKRRTQIMRAPDELTDFIMEEMAMMAETRKELYGFDWHIDHVVPLNGKNVCGLHTWRNLELIPAYHNLRKSNKFEAA
jgi:hypothetical protein